MSDLPDIESVAAIRLGHDAAQEAWVQHFLIENNINASLSPALVATPEQLRFMVMLDRDQVYFPCSDGQFVQLYKNRFTPAMQREYDDAWAFIETLIEESHLDLAAKKGLLLLCRYRFELDVGSRMILPSRLVKRLVALVLESIADPDPFTEKKRRANARMAAIFADPAYTAALEKCPPAVGCDTMEGLRWLLDFTELERLFRMATMRDLWTGAIGPKDLAKDLTLPCKDVECLHSILGPTSGPRKKILYIPDVAGGFVADIRLVQSLLRQGHQVFLALKDAFYFNSPVLWDLETDPVLKATTAGMFVLDTDAVTKNQLLQHIREHKLVIFSDGTTEQMNLYRTSITFARTWKESDLIIAKGRRNALVFLGTSHVFTRDILCFWRDDEGVFRMCCKPGSPNARKFTEGDIIALAEDIIRLMKMARNEGKTVMFYSAIIGSIPGQTETAITVVSTFVNHLRTKMDNTFIINPAEHFAKGLDGDDLMFMWERVQRSGFLDVWRFQTVDDIEISFELMSQKVPAAWIGKDATFSTGCTKEMVIAMDMQAKHPELQIIGPAGEKFFRRREYGVGKYFDVRIKR